MVIMALLANVCTEPARSKHDTLEARVAMACVHAMTRSTLLPMSVRLVCQLQCSWPDSPYDALHRSCVAVWQHDRVKIIANEHGNNTMPSCIAFTDGERLIGEAALSQARF
jgi:hypothetical protein